jgi:hypothetical protein
VKTHFFSELKAFEDFAGLADDANYVTAPDDWLVVITDVEGSTKAIQAGRYKIVNMVGAATVAAIVNAVGTREIPFVFGGDGATAVIPGAALPQIMAALAKSREISRDEHGLNLRIGIVPNKHLREQGAPVRVAKYRLAGNNSIAFFKGHALSLAEKWVKSGKYLLSEEKRPIRFDPHEGLSCRWAPLKNSRGCFLSILVKVNEAKVSEVDTFTKKVIRELGEILDFDSPDAHPVKETALTTEKTLKAASLETSFQTRGTKFKRFLKNLGRMLYIHGLNRGLFKKTFDMQAYRASLALNSDYRKYDEMIRMVVDATPEMKRKCEELLAGYHEKEQVFYGIHESKTALMTCFVQNYQDAHVHFIDGGDGGYAMAAKGLKAQLKEASPRGMSSTTEVLK